ncbi:MAG TPA: hypothetical protein VHD36_11490, partial [Pirellulales bacterium]|nr:hypothetical protein [Pirellulales bacterium]
STGCDIAGMRWQNIDVSRYFASRAKLCFALGEVEKSHEGFFQQAARASSRPYRRSLTVQASAFRMRHSANFLPLVPSCCAPAPAVAGT